MRSYRRTTTAEQFVGSFGPYKEAREDRLRGKRAENFLLLFFLYSVSLLFPFLSLSPLFQLFGPLVVVAFTIGLDAPRAASERRPYTERARADGHTVFEVTDSKPYKLQ